MSSPASFGSRTFPAQKEWRVGRGSWDFPPSYCWAGILIHTDGTVSKPTGPYIQFDGDEPTGPNPKRRGSCPTRRGSNPSFPFSLEDPPRGVELMVFGATFPDLWTEANGALLYFALGAPIHPGRRTKMIQAPYFISSKAHSITKSNWLPSREYARMKLQSLALTVT